RPGEVGDNLPVALLFAGRLHAGGSQDDAGRRGQARAVEAAFAVDDVAAFRWQFHVPALVVVDGEQRVEVGQRQNLLVVDEGAVVPAAAPGDRHVEVERQDQ